MDYEKLHKDTITKLQEMVNSGKITVEIARGICADFVPESEDERIRKELIEFFTFEHWDGEAPFSAESARERIAWLEKQGEQKSADKVEPKKEDTSELTPFEAELFSMMSDAWQGYQLGEEVNIAEIVKEHSSELLERANKQNHAWSEEEENNILFLTSIIEECFKDKEEITLYSDTVCANFTKEDVIDRLKSLRPQNRWKPSKKQIIALRWILNNVPYNKHKEEISGLLDQIKDL